MFWEEIVVPTVTEKISLQRGAAYVAKLTGAPRPHRATLLRWATRGLRGCYLEAEPIGARWFTSCEAIERFLRDSAAAVARGTAAAGPVRAAQVHAAVDELDSMLESFKRKVVAK